MNPTQFFKCLADETRFCLLMLIQSKQQACVCHLMEALQQDQPKISRNLALLRKHKIVQAERRGKWMFYSLHPQLPDWCRSVITLATDHNAASIRDALASINQQNDSPAQCC